MMKQKTEELMTLTKYFKMTSNQKKFTKQVSPLSSLDFYLYAFFFSGGGGSFANMTFLSKTRFPQIATLRNSISVQL